MRDHKSAEWDAAQLPREVELARRSKLEGGAEISADELRTLLELSSELVAITGYDGHFRLLNMAWESALGHTREELRAKPFMEFVHPDDREKTVNMVNRLLPGVPLFSFQNRYICKDGTYRPIHWRGFSSVHGQRYYTVAREVSKEQQAEEQRTILDVVCEQSRDAILMGSASGIITEWTGAGERLFGYSRDELIGESMMRFFSDEAGRPTQLLDLPSPTADADRVRAHFLHRNGTRVPVLVAISPVGNADTLVTGVIATISPA
jgi:PAS domain S-box-containing protein